MCTKQITHDFFKSIEQRNHMLTIQKGIKWNFDFTAITTDQVVIQPDVVVIPTLRLHGLAKSKPLPRTAKT